MLLRSARNQSADWTPFLVGLALAALIGAALAALAAFLLARAVARPVTRVAAASRRLAEGESPDPLPIEGSTELRQLSTAFNDLSEELHRAQDAERAFLLSVSHELKTPLTAIRGHAEGLADGVIEPARAGEVIERESQRLERLIRDLLDLARLRRRSFDVTLRAGRSRRRRERGARTPQPPGARSTGSASICCVEPPAGAIADAGRTLQALSNLVENAIRCTPKGGAVEIVASAGKLSVVDDGPGLAAGDLDRAFERFYLWDRYGADRPVGSGLGLAIVAELATAMGGRVSVESTPGSGSTFTLELEPVDDLRTAYAALRSPEHDPPSVRCVNAPDQEDSHMKRSPIVATAAVLVTLIAATAAFAAGPEGKTLFRYVGQLQSTTGTSVTLNVQNGNRPALRSMLGQGNLSQTFATDAKTVFLKWTDGVPTVTDVGHLAANDYVTVNVRAAHDASLATIAATPAGIVGDRGQTLTKPDQPLYLFRGVLVSTTTGSVTIDVKGGNRHALRLMIGGGGAQQTFTTSGATVFLHWDHRIPSVSDPAQWKAGDRIVIRVRADRGSTLAQVEATAAKRVADREPKSQEQAQSAQA